MTLDKDYMGALLSGLCLIHCLAGPLLIAFGITSIGLSVFEDERIHLFLAVPIFILAAWSIPRGTRIHHHPAPAFTGLVGITALIAGLLIEEMELVLTVTGTCLLIFAHLYNKRLLNHQTSSS